MAINAQRKAAARVQQCHIEGDECGSEPDQLVRIGHQRPDVHLQIGHVNDGLAGGTFVGDGGRREGQTERGQMLAAGNRELHGRTVDELVIVGDVVASLVVRFAVQPPFRLQAGRRAGGPACCVDGAG